MTSANRIPGWPFFDKKNRLRFPCAICGKAYKDQGDAGWCCFNKKESEDRDPRDCPLGPMSQEAKEIIGIHDSKGQTGAKE